jgi:hypothetical protein
MLVGQDFAQEMLLSSGHGSVVDQCITGVSGKRFVVPVSDGVRT